MHPRESTPSLWYTVTAIVVSCIIVTLVLGTTGVVYTQRQVAQSESRMRALQRDSDHRWCALLVQLDNTLPATALIKPTITSLRDLFGCNAPNAPSATYVPRSPTPTGR